MTIQEAELRAIDTLNRTIDKRLKNLAEDVNGDYFERQRQMGSLYLLKSEINKLKEKSLSSS